MLIGVFEEPPPDDLPDVTAISIGEGGAARFAQEVSYQVHLANELLGRIVRIAVP